MANKFTQGKEGEALAYPKTLIDAVLKEENGESIKKNIREMDEEYPINQEVVAAALCILSRNINSVEGGTVKYDDLAMSQSEMDGFKKVAVGSYYARHRESVSYTIEEIVSTALNMLNSLKGIASAIAPQFNGYTSYAVGDCCTHEGQFYERLTAGTGAWDATEWQRTDLATYIAKYYAKNE